MDESFYLGLANELAAKLRRISSFVSHGPSIGAYHEEVLKAILATMLPSRFQLRTGFVYTQENGASQQGDILIVDESNPDAYYFREGNFVVANPGSVVCVIEVKTQLNKRTFKEALAGLHSFREVTTTRSPITFVFAYEAPPFTTQRLGEWYEAINGIPDKIQNYPWVIYALNQGAIILKAPTDGQWGHVPIEGEVNRGSKLKSLSLFLQTVRKALLLHSQVEANPFKNALLDGLGYAEHLYRYGPAAPPVA